MKLGEIVDIFYPKVCYLCNCLLQENGLCHSCWSKVVFIQDPSCIKCGIPFEYEIAEGIICGKCIDNSNNSYVDFSKSVMKYDNNTKKLIMAYKNHSCFYLTNLFTTFLENAGTKWWNEIDYIIPIPLHYWRRYWRGYNQTALLANELSKKTKTKCLEDGLLKVKFTTTQSKFNKAQRWQNVKNTFEINCTYENVIQNKNVLLLDDMTTTGATLNFAALALKKGGVSKVYSLTLAKSI